MAPPVRRFKAGDTIEDVCRACKVDRLHTVVAADANGAPLWVMRDYCSSEHNYSGRPRDEIGGGGGQHGASPVRPVRTTDATDPFPLVSDRERSAPVMSAGESAVDLELLLRRVIREETGLTPVAPADKWRGGALVLRPGKPGIQEKS